jgi:hypothetical protein
MVEAAFTEAEVEDSSSLSSSRQLLVSTHKQKKDQQAWRPLGGVTTHGQGVAHIELHRTMDVLRINDCGKGTGRGFDKT